MTQRWQENQFRGIDLSRRPEDLSPGYMSVCENFVLDGENLLSRAAPAAVLSSPLTGRTVTHISPLGNVAFLIARSTSGRIYKYPGIGGATSVDEVVSATSASAALGANAQLATGFGCGWVVDGVGPLVRVGVVEGISSALKWGEPLALDAPATPTAQIHYETLFAATDTWEQDYTQGEAAEPAAVDSGNPGSPGCIAPASVINEKVGNFWDGSNNPYSFWSTTSGAPTFSTTTLSANGSNAVKLDSASSATTGVDAVQSNRIRFGVPAINTSVRRALAVLEFEAAALDSTRSSEAVKIGLSCFNPTGTEIEEWRAEHISPFLSSTVAAKYRVLVDWRSAPPTGSPTDYPHAFKVEFRHYNDRANAEGVGVNRVRVYLPQMKLGLKLEDDGRTSIRQGTVQVWHGLGMVAAGTGATAGQTSTLTAPPGRLLTAGLRMESDLAATSDWSNVRTLGLEVLPGAGVSGLALRVGFYSDTEWHWSPPLAPQLGSDWWVAELGSVSESLTAVEKIAVEIINDCLIEGLQEGGSSLVFRMGELRNVGNLSLGSPVWYRLAEVHDIEDTTLLGAIYSDGSKPTPLLEATAGSRMGRLTLAADTNPEADYLALYRFGGALLDPSGPVVGRLVCLLDPSGDVAFGEDTDKGTPPRIVAFGNPYVSWDASERVLIDNTPDSWLRGSEPYLSGREQAPAAPSAVAVWDKRVWVSQGSDLYGSWQVDSFAPHGLYWSRLELPEEVDPDAARKGFWERLSGGSITSLVPQEGELVALGADSVFRVVRSGIGWSVARVTGGDAQGVVGPRAACSMDGAAVWMSPQGLRTLSGGVAVPFGAEIFPAIRDASAADRAAAVLSWCPASRKLLVSLAGVLYVWHAGRSGAETERGWTTWTGLNAAVAAELEGTLYLGGSANLFTLTGTGSVAVELETRRFGSGRHFQPTKLTLEVDADASETILASVVGTPATKTSEVSQSIPSGYSHWSIRPTNRAEGATLAVGLSGTVTDRLRVLSLELEATLRRGL